MTFDSALVGEDEPEDAWDRNDPPHLLAENLRRRLELLHALAELDDRQRLRLRHVIDDLEWLRDQFAAVRDLLAWIGRE